MTVDSRVEYLAEFVLKLRRSGYVQATVQGVLESGKKFYQRKLKIDLEGGPSLNSRRDSETVQRRREKLGASETWFGRRRGGDKETETKENAWRKGSQEKEQTSGKRHSRRRAPHLTTRPSPGPSPGSPSPTRTTSAPARQ